MKNLNNSFLFAEIDNRKRGEIKLKLQLAGQTQPQHLLLQGNCHPDLAGRCLLAFNPQAGACAGENPTLDDKHIQPASISTLMQKDCVDEELMKKLKQGDAFSSKSICLNLYSPLYGLLTLELDHLYCQISPATWPWDAQAEKDFQQQISRVNELTTSFCASNEIVPRKIDSREQLLRRVRDLERRSGFPAIENFASQQELREHQDYMIGLMQAEGRSSDYEQPAVIDPNEFPTLEKLQEKDLVFTCWKIIYRLAANSIFLDFSDHLSWPELYKQLTQDILCNPQYTSFSGFGWRCHVDLSASGDQDWQKLHHMYYMDQDERLLWEKDGEKLPSHRPLPYPRSTQMPQAAY